MTKLRNYEFKAKAKDLGDFVEVEALYEAGQVPIEKLREQCHYYSFYFELAGSDYINNSYSDLIIEKLEEKNL